MVHGEMPRARPASLLEAPHLFKRLALARGQGFGPGEVAASQASNPLQSIAALRVERDKSLGQGRRELVAAELDAPATSSSTSGEGTCLAQCRDAVGELRRRRRASSHRHARCEDDCLLRDGVADHSPGLHIGGIVDPCPHARIPCLFRERA
jgi:hypothetical protein